MVTIYEKDSGKPVIFAHTIDAKESITAGFYVATDPRKAKVVIEKVSEVLVPEEPELEEPKPTVIPTPVARRSMPKPITKKSPIEK